mmetsp:Transcript_17719/g.44257  ORF Transcript_17719/g.44257 Transcript_17719/m.44257 type:complete len:289 (-) Transcript_17719:807-1673(-)
MHVSGIGNRPRSRYGSSPLIPPCGRSSWWRNGGRPTDHRSSSKERAWLVFVDDVVERIYEQQSRRRPVAPSLTRTVQRVQHPRWFDRRQQRKGLGFVLQIYCRGPGEVLLVLRHQLLAKASMASASTPSIRITSLLHLVQQDKVVERSLVAMLGDLQLLLLLLELLLQTGKLMSRSRVSLFGLLQLAREIDFHCVSFFPVQFLFVSSLDFRQQLSVGCVSPDDFVEEILVHPARAYLVRSPCGRGSCCHPRNALRSSSVSAFPSTAHSSHCARGKVASMRMSCRCGGR